MGTVFLSADHKEIRELLEAVNHPFGKDTLQGSRVDYVPDTEARSEGVAYAVWCNEEVRRMLGNPNMSDRAVAWRLLRDIGTYVGLHRRILGRYRHYGFLPARPEKEIFGSELNCMIGEFLQKHCIESLVPIFKLAHTLQGYGHLERTPAVYGLMWMTPQLLSSLAEGQKNRMNVKGPT